MKYVVVWLFIICNLLFVFQMEFEGFTEHFALANDRLWRIDTWFTHMFLHGDVGHLLSNLFVLLPIGVILQRRMISGMTVLKIALITGLIGGFFTMIESYFVVDYTVLLVGASGMLYGLIGALVYYLPNIDKRPFRGLMFLIFFLPLSMALVESYLFPDNVSHIAHLTAFLAGFILPRYISPRFHFIAEGQDAEGKVYCKLVFNINQAIDFMVERPSLFKMRALPGSRNLTEGELQQLNIVMEEIKAYCRHNGIKFEEKGKGDESPSE